MADALRFIPIPFDITPYLINFSAWESVVSIIKQSYVESEQKGNKN